MAAYLCVLPRFRAQLLDSVQILPLPNIYKVPFDCCGRSHQWADEVRPATFTLSAFKIPVRRARASFAAQQHVVIHADTHAATGVAPFKSGVEENLVEAFGLRFSLHTPRTGHNE